MYAYLDAGTGSVLLAAFAGGAAGIAVLGRVYWHRFLGIFSKKHRAAADARASGARAADREVQGILVRALHELDEDYRAVVVLRDIEGFDYREIGEILDIPHGTVKSRLHRAREALRGARAIREFENLRAARDRGIRRRALPRRPRNGVPRASARCAPRSYGREPQGQDRPTLLAHRPELPPSGRGPRAALHRARR